jgi:hypothetical protein
MTSSRLLLAFALVLGIGPAGLAQDAPSAPRPVPTLASTPDAKAALAKFKEAFKAKDPAAKADAVDGLGKTNHPFVVQELVKLTRHKDAEIRAAAFMNLGDQRAIPGVVGAEMLKLLDVKSQDWEFLAHVIDAIEGAGCRGAWQPLVTLLHHDNQIVVRWALSALGDLKEVRAVDAVVALIKELKIEEGVSWDGVEVNVDTGAAGSGDQQKAEAIGKAMLAANKAKGRSGARKMRNLGSIVYDVLKDLTGQQFKSGNEARAWVEAHKAELDAQKKALDAEQKAQEEQAKAALAAAKAGK